MLIGAISDTHGLLRPRVFEVFQDVDCIIHAGDVGSEDILTELATLAPVYAVYGNVDGFALLERLPDRLLITLGEIIVFVTHIGGKLGEIRSRYAEIDQADLVIYGHSHQPAHLEEAGKIFFNPGSAGPRRFSLPVTVGKIEIQASRILPRFIDLL